MSLEDLLQLEPITDNGAQDDEFLYLATSFSIIESDLCVLPSSIGVLTQLRHLNLAGNQLSDLPDSVSCLQKLELLELSNNQLSIMPDYISHFVHLTEINLSDNQVSFSSPFA
eukprot:TRINITY_DN10173_c0_g1_i29.p1 TRINITY_DN10173_c0_g1~~TRINITY_DN10173_c0_g1_i29.p1  ORF type:complete len:113 (+),score=26.92 TRINITY_DN10173_c0_g1_i29:43-381(+)